MDAYFCRASRIIGLRAENSSKQPMGDSPTRQESDLTKISVTPTPHVGLGTLFKHI